MPQPLTRLTGPFVRLDAPDVDTDRIIPARFLTTVSRAGLGAHLFADWRAAEPAVAAALEGGAASGAPFLVAGPNFGCGSSREHAVWALLDAGYRCVIAPSFADIFRGNALRNGVVPVAVNADFLAALEEVPRGELILDLERGQLHGPNLQPQLLGLAPFEARCLRSGWDGLDYLLSLQDFIDSYEQAQP